jgi:triacylglycerol lipase
MNKTIPTHAEITDFAKLTLLVYEYGKAYEVDKKTTIEEFVANVVEKNEQDTCRMDVITELAKSSPHGRVHKFFNNPNTDLQAGITISETHNRICVIFRGSESKYDWYYDLAFFKTQLHNDVYVHGGFHTHLHDDCMYDQITIELKDLLMKNPDYDIYVTGHSLGAALSTLYGYELSKEIPNKITVVSFASPRVGNTPFKNAFDSQPNLVHYRVTNKRDIVTAAPNINFTHVGINITLTDSKSTIFYNYDYPWYYFTFFTCWSIRDHSMDVYYNRLKNNIWTQI